MAIDFGLRPPALQVAFQDHVDAVTDAERRLKRVEEQISGLLPEWNLRPVVDALQAMRGIALITAVVLVAEVGDFTRFASPRQLMAYFNLVPGERSERRDHPTRRHCQDRQRPCPTRAGRKRMGLPNESAHRSSQGRSDRNTAKSRSRHRVESASSTLHSISSAERARQDRQRRQCRHRTRDGGFIWSIACTIQSAPKTA